MKLKLIKLFALAYCIAGVTLAMASGDEGHQRVVAKFQKTLNEEYLDSTSSPLYPLDRAAFRGHDFFPISEKYRVVARLHYDITRDTVLIPTASGRVKKYLPYALATFEIDGHDDSLTIYQSIQLMSSPEYQDYLFLPYRDYTNGESTYGGGRYIDLVITDGDLMSIDFNISYNPYCAYSEEYNCPIVPVENTVNIPIEAGVRLTGGHFDYHKPQD